MLLVEVLVVVVVGVVVVVLGSSSSSSSSSSNNSSSSSTSTSTTSTTTLHRARDMIWQMDVTHTLALDPLAQELDKHRTEQLRSWRGPWCHPIFCCDAPYPQRAQGIRLRSCPDGMAARNKSVAPHSTTKLILVV